MDFPTGITWLAKIAPGRISEYRRHGSMVTLSRVAFAVAKIASYRIRRDNPARTIHAEITLTSLAIIRSGRSAQAGGAAGPQDIWTKKSTVVGYTGRCDPRRQ
jgi:hypothetical protein